MWIRDRPLYLQAPLRGVQCEPCRSARRFPMAKKSKKAVAARRTKVKRSAKKAASKRQAKTKRAQKKSVAARAKVKRGGKKAVPAHRVKVRRGEKRAAAKPAAPPPVPAPMADFYVLGDRAPSAFTHGAGGGRDEITFRRII
jgi:hypothetical protein